MLNQNENVLNVEAYYNAMNNIVSKIYGAYWYSLVDIDESNLEYVVNIIKEDGQIILNEILKMTNIKNNYKFKFDENDLYSPCSLDQSMKYCHYLIYEFCLFNASDGIKIRIINILTELHASINSYEEAKWGY